MESLTRSAKGRKTKKSEARTENINIRGTKTEVETLRAIIAINKEKGKIRSQSDVLFGGMQSGEAISNFMQLRNDLVSEEYNLRRSYKSSKKNKIDDADFLLGKAEMLEEVIRRIDRIFSKQ